MQRCTCDEEGEGVEEKGWGGEHGEKGWGGERGEHGWGGG